LVTQCFEFARQLDRGPLAWFCALAVWVESREVYTIQEAFHPELEDTFRIDQMLQALDSRPFGRRRSADQQVCRERLGKTLPAIRRDGQHSLNLLD
jgi:hypothetical protein